MRIPINFFNNIDSDDSDTEGGLGNVERVVMRPPGHSGKAKKGHLCFDSSFETGKKDQLPFMICLIKWYKSLVMYRTMIFVIVI